MMLQLQEGQNEQTRNNAKQEARLQLLELENRKQMRMIRDSLGLSVRAQPAKRKKLRTSPRRKKRKSKYDKNKMP